MLRTYWGSDSEPKLDELQDNQKSEQDHEEDPLEEMIAFEIKQRKKDKEGEGKIIELLSEELLKMTIDNVAAGWNAPKNKQRQRSYGISSEMEWTPEEFSQEEWGETQKEETPQPSSKGEIQLIRLGDRKQTISQSLYAWVRLCDPGSREASIGAEELQADTIVEGTFNYTA